MKRVSFIVFLFAACFLLRAEDPAGLQLEGVEWELLDAAGKRLEMPDGKPGPWIRFGASEKKVSGNGGCNGFSGTYSSDKDLIRFESVIATRMACSPARNALEREFLSALEHAARWKIDQDQLLLLDGSGEILARLARKQTSPEPPGNSH